MGTTSPTSEVAARVGRREEWTPWLATLAIALAFGVVIGIQGLQDFDQLEREAENSTIHAAELLHENATRALGEVALTLEDLRLALQSDGSGPLPANDHLIRERFLGKLVHLPQVEALVVLDAAGRASSVASLNPDFVLGADLLSWFGAQRTDVGAGLSIGLVRQAQDGGWRLVLARKIMSPSGNVRSVVGAVIGSAYFQDLVRGQAFVARGGITYLLGVIGTETLLAHSAREGGAGRTASDKLIVPPLPEGPAGTFETELAGRDWIASYRRLPNQQIAVGVALDKAGVLSEWWARRLPTLVMTAAFLSLLGLFTGFATRHIRRRRAAEISMLASEERFRDVAEASSDWIWETGSDLRFRFVSQRAEAVFGVQRSFLLGMPVQALFSESEVAASDVDQLQRLTRREPFRDAVGRLVLPGGETKHVKLSAKPLWTADRVFAGYRGTGTDITVEIEAHRGAEQARTRLIDAVESLSQGFALFDSWDRLVLCNSKYRELHGSIAGMLAGDREFREIVTALAESELQDVAAEERAAWVAQRLEAHSRGHGRFEYRCGSRWLMVTERATHDGGTVCVETDITELKEGEQALIAAKTAAELGNRAKTEFLANMSHELRTPLNAIIGFSEVMVGEMFGPIGHAQYREYSHDIHKSGQHLLDIISDILDMSKIESGKMEPRHELVDLPSVVASCLRLLNQRAEEAGHVVVVDVPETTPKLLADAHMIKRILLNLLSNAVKFTPNGGTVEVRATPDAAGGLVLSVSDTGIGIAAEHAAKVWAPFGQVENAMQRKYQGTGLGLPLVKSMAELHQATLRMDSIVGEGTRIEIHFPRIRVVHAGPSTAMEEPAAKEDGPELPSPPRSSGSAAPDRRHDRH